MKDYFSRYKAELMAEAALKMAKDPKTALQLLEGQILEALTGNAVYSDDAAKLILQEYAEFIRSNGGTKS